MYKIHVSVPSDKKGKWFETPEEADDALDLVLISWTGKEDEIGEIDDIDGYTYLNPDNHELNPCHLAYLTKLNNEFGLVAEIFAERFGLHNIRYFTDCYIADFDSLRDFAIRCRNKGVFRDLGLTDKSIRIEEKALEVVDFHNWSIIVEHERVYLFDGMTPIINDFI